MNTRRTSAGLKVLDSQDEEMNCIEQVVNKQFGDQQIDVLDAGCGRKWQIKLRMPYTITGIDTDEAALARRQDLDVALVEDIRGVTMPQNQFDLIYCSYVLEHIDGAESLLERFLNWLRPNGLLVLRFPDKNTVFGFITRKTPYWVHVAYKKHLLQMKMAGTEGHGPYPTVYDDVVSRTGMQKFCREQNLNVLGEWATDKTLPRRGRLLWLRKAVITATYMLSLGKLDSTYNNLTFVIQKPIHQSIPA